MLKSHAQSSIKSVFWTGAGFLKTGDTPKYTWICFSTQLCGILPSIVALVVFPILGLDAEVGTPDPLEVLVDHVGLHGVEGVDPVPDVPVEHVTLATPIFPNHFPDRPCGKGF